MLIHTIQSQYQFYFYEKYARYKLKFKYNNFEAFDAVHICENVELFIRNVD